MDTKLEVVRYLESDVIATSGEYRVEGMSESSHELLVGCCGGDVCAWLLQGTSVQKISTKISYYDENGNYIEDASLKTNGWINLTPTTDGLNSTGKWFHYVPGTSTYILCNDSNHHDSN